MGHILSRTEIDKLLGVDKEAKRKIVTPEESKLLSAAIREFEIDNDIGKGKIDIQDIYILADSLGLKDFVLYDSEANIIKRTI